MIALMKYEIKKLYYKRETWIVLIACVVLAVAALFESTSYRSYMADSSQTESAIETSMLYLSGIGNLTFICFVPLFCGIICAEVFWEENKNHSIIIVVTRTNYSKYHVVKLILTVIICFVVSALPFTLNLLMSSIAFPIKGIIPNSSVYSPYFSYELSYIFEHALFPILYANWPLIDAFAHIGLIGVYGIGMGLLTYAISLYYNKSKIVVVTFATVFGVVAALLISALKINSLVLFHYFIAYSPYKEMSLGIFFASMGVLVCTALGFILFKLNRNKDILV